jgi:TolB-like protein
VKQISFIAILFSAFAFSGCQSTQSVVVNQSLNSKPVLAVFELEGDYGKEASGLISQELALNGVPSLERSQIESIFKEHSYHGDARFDQSSVSEYGNLLGVNKILIGNVRADGGPLYSFPHIFITLKLIDVETGNIKWIGKYGNPSWTSATSTMGDLNRGAKHIVKEFLSKYPASSLLEAK